VSNRRFRSAAILRGLLLREPNLFAIMALLVFGLLRFGHAWIRVPNPDYDASAGKVERCVEEACWNMNPSEMTDDSRLNVALVALFVFAVLVVFTYKKLEPTLSLEKHRRGLRKEFLNGKITALEMQSLLATQQYFALLGKWVEQSKMSHKHQVAAREEWLRNPDPRPAWRYPVSELRRMYDRNELTLDQFESLSKQNSEWFDLPERVRKDYYEGRRTEKQFQDTLYRAGYDHDKWWTAGAM
jgi:hypothetical protein